MAQNFLKDPQSVVDFAVDWTTWLAGSSPTDTISTSTWTVDSGITQDSESETSTKATIWLSGGTAGVTYKAVNKIVTAGARTIERTIYITVVQR